MNSASFCCSQDGYFFASCACAENAQQKPSAALADKAKIFDFMRFSLWLENTKLTGNFFGHHPALKKPWCQYCFPPGFGEIAKICAE